MIDLLANVAAASAFALTIAFVAVYLVWHYRSQYPTHS